MMKTYRDAAPALRFPSPAGQLSGASKVLGRSRKDKEGERKVKEGARKVKEGERKVLGSSRKVKEGADKGERKVLEVQGRC